VCLLVCIEKRIEKFGIAAFVCDIVSGVGLGIFGWGYQQMETNSSARCRRCLETLLQTMKDNSQERLTTLHMKIAIRPVTIGAIEQM